VAQHSTDDTVLGKIQSLAHEEQLLYGHSCRIPTRFVWRRFALNSTNAGISYGSGERAASSGRILTARRFGPPRLWSVTSNRARPPRPTGRYAHA